MVSGSTTVSVGQRHGMMGHLGPVGRGRKETRVSDDRGVEERRVTTSRSPDKASVKESCCERKPLRKVRVSRFMEVVRVLRIHVGVGIGGDSRPGYTEVRTDCRGDPVESLEVQTLQVAPRSHRFGPREGKGPETLG